MIETRPSRKLAIDVMRILGLFLVILAHCGIPSALFSIRQFDVTMLVFISGMSFSFSQKEKDDSWLSYIWKRIKRLILPVWVFLTIYFFVFGIILKQNYETKTILTSYLLISGIGYVWIFRVLFGVSITNSIYRKFIRQWSFWKVILVGILLLIANDCVYHFGILQISNAMIQDVLKVLISFTIGYGVVSVVGMSWDKGTKKDHILSVVLFACIFILLGIVLRFPNIQDYKHPPMLYYISFGMIATGLIYEALEMVSTKRNKCGEVIVWLSKNSMTIYLWHIFALTLELFVMTTFVQAHWYILYLFLIVFAILMTYIQNFIMNGVFKWKGR